MSLATYKLCMAEVLKLVCENCLAEHEALKKQLFEAVNNYGNLQAEVDRLKKEVEEHERIGRRWERSSDEWLQVARKYRAEVERLKNEHERVIRSYDHVIAASYDREERLKKEHERVCGEYDDMIRRMPSEAEVEKLLGRITCLLADKTLLQEDVERLKNELDLKANDFNDGVQEGLKRGVVEGERRSKAEIERLKKELSDMGERAVRDMYDENCEGIAEGERRAMERLKEVIKRAKSRVADTSEGRAYYLAIVDIETDAGLGEEERPVVFKCSCTLAELKERSCPCGKEEKR